MTRFLLAASILVSSSAMGLHASDLVGSWEATVASPDGNGEMYLVYTFTAKDGKLSGTVHTDQYGDFPMNKVDVDGDSVSFFIPTDDGGYSIEGKLADEGLVCNAVGPNGPLPELVLKRKAADVTGTWRGTIQGPNGASDVVYTFRLENGKLAGSVQGPMGEASFINTSIDGNKVSFESDYQGYHVTRKGTVTGDTMQLTISIEGYEANVTLTRDRQPAKSM